MKIGKYTTHQLMTGRQSNISYPIGASTGTRTSPFGAQIALPPTTTLMLSVFTSQVNLLTLQTSTASK